MKKEELICGLIGHRFIKVGGYRGLTFCTKEAYCKRCEQLFTQMPMCPPMPFPFCDCWVETSPGTVGISKELTDKIIREGSGKIKWQLFRDLVTPCLYLPYNFSVLAFIAFILLVYH